MNIAIKEIQDQSPTPSVALPAQKIKKVKKLILKGIAHIYATFNNTIISISDEQGKIFVWSSAGASGFKGSKKSTPFAAQVVAANVVKKAIVRFGLKSVAVNVKGMGPGRNPAIRGIQANGLEITIIKDVTPIPFNGCRPPKKPRN